MMPEPHIVLADNIQYKLRFTYRQMDQLNGPDPKKKQEVFDWVVNTVSQFISRRDPTFRADQMGTVLILQVDNKGYQDSQMLQDSLAIEHNKGKIVRVHRRPFTVEEFKPEPNPCPSASGGANEVVPATSSTADDDDVVITNDDNADVSLPTCTPQSSVPDHDGHPRRSLSLSRKNLPKINATKQPEAVKPIVQKVSSSNPPCKPILQNILQGKQQEKPVQQVSVAKPREQEIHGTASCSSSQSQSSILDVMDDSSDSDVSTIDPNSYMFYEHTEDADDDQTLDDIPHVMDPVVERFMEMEKARKETKSWGMWQKENLRGSKSEEDD